MPSQVILSKKIFAPINGEIINIESVVDPVFAEKMLGDGIAIRPDRLLQIVYSPCDGVVETLHGASNHAIAIKNHVGDEILIHIGIDTVKLKGKGFKPFVEVGNNIKKGDKLIEVDFPYIMDNATSADVIMVVTNMQDNTVITKTTKKFIKTTDEIFIISDKKEEINNEESINNSQSNNIATSGLLTVINETGIHARPASMIFQIASKYQSKVELKKDEKIINAKSIIAILGLAVKFNDAIEVVAVGEDSNQAVEEIKKAILSGLGEGNNKHDTSNIKIKSHENEQQIRETNHIIKDFSKEVSLKGIIAAPGLVIGKAFTLKEEEINIIENSQDKNIEIKILENCLLLTKNKIEEDISLAREQKQRTKVEIFTTHLDILQDPNLINVAKQYIEKGKTAAFAWKRSIDESIQILRKTENQILMERVADLKDIEKRLLKSILNIPDTNIIFPEDSILIAKELIPSDLAKLDSNIKGVILEFGSSTSHVALMLRNMGTPSLVALGESLSYITNGTNIILDANEKNIIVNPEQNKLKDIREKKIQIEKIKAENIMHSKEDAITIDGKQIIVKGNVSNGFEAGKALQLGGEGIGLLRTEFLFFNSKNEPSEQEQLDLYQNALDAMQGGSVTLRTLDVGGDKPLEYVKIGYEENPILGLRGVRNYFNNESIFLNQLRAILKVKPLMLVKIMIPMIAELEEIIRVKEVIEREKKSLGITEKLDFGIMIEVPSAALLAEQIAPYVDFFSIGTNDLTQYTLAMDRGNSNLTSRLNNLHPSILKLIKITVDGANKYNKPTAICGAMASEIKSIPILIGLGIKELSTSMRSIPDVKALIRTLDYEKCKKIADLALNQATAKDVEQLITKEFKL
jgi:multiphosphoryl transfer protein